MAEQQSDKQMGKEFSDFISLQEEVYDLVKKLLIETTEDAFKKLGFKPADSYKGVYGNDEKFGNGTAADKFNIRIIGKTKSFIEKDIILGAKRTSSIINMDLQHSGMFG